MLSVFAILGLIYLFKKNTILIQYFWNFILF